MKKLLIIVMILVGSFLTDGFTASLGGLVLLIAGMMAGHADGVKDGKRLAFGGKDKNPIK